MTSACPGRRSRVYLETVPVTDVGVRDPAVVDVRGSGATQADEGDRGP